MRWVGRKRAWQGEESAEEGVGKEWGRRLKGSGEKE